MAAPADYLDTVNLKAIAAGGFVNEDVLQKIQDASTGVKPIFLDMIGRSPISNSYTEWTEDKLEAPDVANAAISGADAVVANQTMSSAARVGNHTQISTKVVAVTERAQNTDVIGQSDALGYRTMRKLLELKRDVEAIALSNQASVADNNNNVAGKSAGLGAFIKTHSYSGASGAAGGFNNSTKVVTAPTPGNRRTATLAQVRTAIGALYEEGVGENGLVVMSTPSIIAGLSEKLRTDASGNFVQPTANIQGSGSAVDQYAQGWTNAFVTDFGIRCKLVPNRLMTTYTSADSHAVGNLFIFDPDYLALGFLHDFKVEPLAKIGLSHRRLLSTDWALKVLLEKACAVIRDINPATPF
jgi:hypothetical protein